MRDKGFQSISTRFARTSYGRLSVAFVVKINSALHLIISDSGEIVDIPKGRKDVIRTISLYWSVIVVKMTSL